ncbi:MAG: hypothetical protein ACRESO_00325, partial [Gammaproteobacteria bacterium]
MTDVPVKPPCVRLSPNPDSLNRMLFSHLQFIASTSVANRRRFSGLNAPDNPIQNRKGPQRLVKQSSFI